MVIRIITYSLGSVSEWITSIAGVLALIGVWVAYIGYRERTRPYIDIEVKNEIDGDNWYFHAEILNKGQYPVYSRITNAVLIIGDEKYPTIFENEIVTFPGEDKKFLAPVGHINGIGRQRIREAKYTKNLVELMVEVSSRKIKQKTYQYRTMLKLQVLVEGDFPQFKLLEQSFL